MVRILTSLLFGVVCALVSWAATPVARVIGTQSVEVGGITAPARNYVPLALGEDVTTQDGTATVQFRDGSNIVLQPNSQLKIGGQQALPEVRIMRGSAVYDLVPAAKIRVVNSKGEAIDDMLSRALPNPAAMSRLNDPATAALIYRSPAVRQSGLVVPSSAFSVGTFSFTGGRGAGSGGATIVTPNGLVFNLAPVQNAQGVVTGYTIASISTTVTNPTTGQAVPVQITTGPLVGATLQGITPSTQPGAAVTISVVPAGGSTPLDLQTTVQQGLQQAVNTAVQSGQLPAGTTPPTMTPVTTGQFSSSAP